MSSEPSFNRAFKRRVRPPAGPIPQAIEKISQQRRPSRIDEWSPHYETMSNAVPVMQGAGCPVRCSCNLDQGTGQAPHFVPRLKCTQVA